MHHLHIVARGEGQRGKGFPLAKYMPGQGYSLLCDRAQLAEWLKAQDPEETPHVLVIVSDETQPPKGHTFTRDAQGNTVDVMPPKPPGAKTEPPEAREKEKADPKADDKAAAPRGKK